MINYYRIDEMNLNCWNCQSFRVGVGVSMRKEGLITPTLYFNKEVRSVRLETLTSVLVCLIYTISAWPAFYCGGCRQ